MLQYLQNCLKNESLAHAYLLLGTAGSGQMALLQEFLPDLLQTSQIANHPDIKTVMPEDELISIETIRDLRFWLGQSPLAAKCKAAVITGAEKMNHEAQNAFLKVLEEPVPNTYIFLLAGHRQQLLPTIFSRVVPLYFTAKTKPAIEDDLLKEILAIDGPGARMRWWMQNGPKTDKNDKTNKIKAWLENIVPDLRALLLVRPTKNLVKTIRDLLTALSGPKGQNWQLIAENLIISL